MTPTADIFIQVRRGSSRVADKALLPLGDRTCLEHVVVRMRDARLARHVVVCTSDRRDDAVLVDEARRLGVESFRGDLDNVIARFLSAAEHFGTEVIARVTGDSPLASPETVDGAIEHLVAERLDYVRQTTLPVGCAVEVFTVEALGRAAIAALDASRSEDLTYFVGREEINRVGEHLPPPELRRRDLVLALNRPEDVDVLREVFERAPAAGPYLTLGEAIAWLDAHPEVAARNRDYTPTPTRCDTRLDPARLAAAS